MLTACMWQYLTPTGVHLVNGSLQHGVGGLDQLHLSAHVALHVRAHQEIVLPPFLRGQTGFGLDDGVDASNFTHASTQSRDEDIQFKKMNKCDSLWGQQEFT